MPLQKQVMELTPTGVNTKSDPKTAQIGQLVAGDNVQALRHAGPGAELRKRFGFSPLTRAIAGGGSIAKCVKGAEYNNELVLCDGLRLYTYSTILGKWISKGRHQTIACDVDLVSGSESTAVLGGGVTLPGSRANVDSANFGNYRAVVTSSDFVTATGSDFSPSKSHLYIKDSTTGGIVGSIPDVGFRAKLVTLGTSLFVAGSNGTGTIVVSRVDASDPTQIAASFNAATDSDNTGNDSFDICADAAHNVVWIAYNNSAAQLTIGSITPALTIGVSAAHVSTWSPSYAIGFLSWDFSNARGYIGIGTSNTVPGIFTEAHVVEFNTSTAVVTSDTALNGGIGTQYSIDQIVGYRTAAGKVGVFYYVNDGTGNWRQSYTIADFDGNQYLFSLGSCPNGRAFKINGKWYIPMAIGVDEDGSRSILMEVDEGATNAFGLVSFCGLFQSQDATGRPLSAGCVSSCPVSGSSVFMALPSVVNRAALFAQINDQRYGVSLVSMDFSGAGLGAPVVFDSVFHMPSLAHKTYDGKSVFEAMFYADGPALATLSSDASAGAMTPLGSYQYCTTVSRIDAKGRLVRSAPGPISTVVMGASDTEVTVESYLFPFTENHQYYNEDQDVARLSLEIWRTEADEEAFYLCQVSENDLNSIALGLGVFTVTAIDGTADADLVKNELLYTDAGDLDNVKAPAVKVIDVWQNRAFALTGDNGAIWFSKSAFEGFGAEFSDANRFLLDDRGGKPIDICHVDATLVMLKRDIAYLLQGDGPDDKGAGPFAPPVRMSADLGIIAAGARMSVDNGELIQTPKGMFTLTRGLAWEATDGVEGYTSSMTIAGGASLDSRHMAIAVTNDRVLVRDYLFGIWLSWTNAGSLLAGVAVARWLNNAAIFKADGTVYVEVPGQYFDGTSTTINELVSFGYFCPKNGRVYQMNFVGDWQATTTISETTTFDYDTGTAETKTRATTAADKTALSVVPSRGRFNAITVTFQETSTTEGFRLSRIDVEYGQKTGLKKSGSSKFFR